MRLRDQTTGSIVHVDDDLGQRLLGGDYEAAGADKPVGYDTQTVAALKAEITRRNEGREDDALILADGKKADLVAALTADDDTSTTE